MKTDDRKNIKTLNFSIEGMHCAACSARVEAALKKHPQIADAAVNIATREALIQTASDSLKPGDLQQILSTAGDYRIIEQSDSTDPDDNDPDKNDQLLLKWKFSAGLILSILGGQIILCFGMETAAAFFF
jgi:cation transport ATPase